MRTAVQSVRAATVRAMFLQSGKSARGRRWSDGQVSPCERTLHTASRQPSSLRRHPCLSSFVGHFAPSHTLPPFPHLLQQRVHYAAFAPIPCRYRTTAEAAASRGESLGGAVVAKTLAPLLWSPACPIVAGGRRRRVSDAVDVPIPVNALGRKRCVASTSGSAAAAASIAAAAAAAADIEGRACSTKAPMAAQPSSTARACEER